MSIITETIKTKGIRGMYSGAGALIAGNGLKAGVRFMTYDSVKEMFRDENVSLLSCSVHNVDGLPVHNGARDAKGCVADCLGQIVTR